MPNCFVFAIGGTGSRVLRSLTHLLASGVKTRSNFNIIPIIIDPHVSNDDLKRTVSLLEHYKNVRKAYVEGQGANTKAENPTGFFSTEIETLKDANAKADIPADFTFELEGAKSQFRTYLGHLNMNEENAALVELLFSGHSKDNLKKTCDLLDITMDIGFVGNPNVGSVVLNQISESKIYNAFTDAFNADDRIFIISSIFGGTGAAGFPCLLKNIRREDGKSAGVLRDAKVGAVTVLPYFKLDDDPDKKSPIRYSDFVAKTKSALHYYKSSITGNNSVNAMYYIGDRQGKRYGNDPGYGGQQNDANFIELASALAVIDFLDMPNEMLETRNGKAVNPQYREFGIKRNVDLPGFKDLGKEEYMLLSKPLTQFALFRKYMDEEFDNKAEKQAWSTQEPKIGKGFKGEIFYRFHLGPFFEDFYAWLKELSTNNRGFAPLNIARGADLHMFITDSPLKKPFIGSAISYDNFEHNLNDLARKLPFDKEKGHAKKMLDIFYNTTDKLFTEKYNK
jgi:hypothetical protein